MQYKIGDMVRITHTDYLECGLDVGTVHKVVGVDDPLIFLTARYDDGSTSRFCFDANEVEPDTPSTPTEIEWGEWGEPLSGYHGPWQCQFVNGSAQWRYPVPKQPVVETVTLGGFHWNCEWHFRGIGRDARQTARITFDVIDGKPDWSTLRGEDLS